MKVYLLMSALVLSSCASSLNLKESKSCNVWEEQSVLGPRSVQVVNNEANWKGNCRFFFVLWCDWVKADMPASQDGIYLEGNGIFNSRKLVAKLSSETMTYEPTFLDGLIKTSPMTIDRKNSKTKRVVTAIGNMKAEEEFEFNQSCTSQQVAVGSVALIALKNRN